MVCAEWPSFWGKAEIRPCQKDETCIARYPLSYRDELVDLMLNSIQRQYVNDMADPRQTAMKQFPAMTNNLTRDLHHHCFGLPRERGSEILTIGFRTRTACARHGLLNVFLRCIQRERCDASQFGGLVPRNFSFWSDGQDRTGQASAVMGDQPSLSSRPRFLWRICKFC